MADNSKKKKIIVIVIALVLVIAGVVAFLIFRNTIKATTMRILRLEGTVNLQADGAMKNVKENLRLVSGNVLDTSTESLVSIGLDDAKIVTLDELSRAEFNQSGKYLNLDLTKGSLFFEVDRPLADDETFEIETSTMIVGIRGTSGWVSVDGENESLIITDGHVHVVGTNPVTKEVKEIEVSAGQRLVVYLYNDRNVDSIMFELEDITERDLPDFVIKLLRENAALLDRVIAATGWDRNYILGISDAEPEPDPDNDPSGTQVADTDPEPEPEPEPQPEPEPEPANPDGDGNNDTGPAQGNAGNNNAGNNNNNNNANNNNNNGNNNAAAFNTAPVTKTEIEKQIDAARAQIVSTNADGTYTLADNTVFDPVYYGQTYTDVVAQYGDSSEALLAHYVATGQGEGRYASKDEQDADELAKAIARNEEADAARAAAAASNNSQQTQNNNPSKVSGNRIEFAGGAQGDYNAGQITLTDPDGPNLTVATLPATYADENGVDQNVVLTNITVPTTSNVSALDVTNINASANEITSWIRSQNNAKGVYVVDSVVTYELQNIQGNQRMEAGVAINSNDTISSLNSIIPSLDNQHIDIIVLPNSGTYIEYNTGNNNLYTLFYDDANGQPTSKYVTFESATSTNTHSHFKDATGSDYYINSSGTVSNTP